MPPTAQEELHRLVHGPCDPAFLTELHKALATDDPQLLHRLGALGATLPPADRLFEDPARLTALHAWTAVTDPSLCLAALVHHLLCLGSMARLGDGSTHLAGRMEALRSGRAKGVYLITEAGRANSHLATRTVAELDPESGEFVLHTPDPGAAKFGSAGTLDVPQTAVVLARLVTDGTDRGVFGFVVDLSGAEGLLPGIEVSSPLGLGALPLDYVQVRFDHVRVPYGQWLADGAARESDGTFHDPAGSPERRLERTLRVGQGLWATMPAVAAATARQSAVQAVDYARGRPTQARLSPGAPLLSYRTQQRAVLGALADAFALTCAAHGARRVWEESLAGRAQPPGTGTAMGFTPWAAVSRPLAAYKAVTVRLAAQLIAECRRRCGFSGHLDANRLAAYGGFHDAFDTAGGDSQLILYDIGRALADEAREADGPEAPVTALPSPLAPGWWTAVVRRHEATLARELAHRSRATGDRTPFEVWNPLLEDAGLLGEVHATALLAGDTVRALDAVQDQSLAEALRPLAALHGVVAARRLAGSLLAHGTLRPADVRELPGAADELCDALLPRLPLLTEAFAFPKDLAADPTWTRGGTA
ncbi:acyl-CoA dehydrogenase [Streptomyces sp. SID13726]|uniref:acyl-CoA dehydrogenase family protein n=1 Tax=Streptomyces sp. SID13726 TaxID=2706058 RepID=UPI0013B5F608|nr:acyl-CoA dehydrogenase [Streptomyces sp. SID13726]NEB00382.1 acyl-CoA oxidase [Streptomyces sp. SID13726]